MKLPVRSFVVIAVVLTLSGCAAHRVQVAQGPDPLYDWASVVAIPREAPVRVTRDYDIDGRLDDVTDSTLTIGVPPDMHRLTISRAHVVRVAVLSPKKMRWRWLGKPLAVGVIGGLVGGLVGAVMKDAQVASISLGVFTVSSIGWFHHLVYDHFDHEWRVVYLRPSRLNVGETLNR